MPRIEVPPVKVALDIADDTLGLDIRYHLTSEELVLLQRVVCEKAKEKLDSCKADNGTIMFNSFGDDVKFLTDLAVHLSNPDVVGQKLSEVTK